jgi:Ca2+-binding RTX toxin-like protein
MGVTKFTPGVTKPPAPLPTFVPNKMPMTVSVSGKVVTVKTTPSALLQIVLNNDTSNMVNMRADKNGLFTYDVSPLYNKLPSGKATVQVLGFGSDGNSTATSSVFALPDVAPVAPVIPVQPPKPAPVPVVTPVVNTITKIAVSDTKDLFSGGWAATTMPLFKDGISITDVQQNMLLDCWYMATLAAYAYQTPDFIFNNIKANTNGGYDVTLNKSIYAASQFATPGVKNVYSVSNTLSINGPDAIERGDTWVTMFEKAGAKAADAGTMVGATKTNLSSFKNLDWGYPAFAALDSGGPAVGLSNDLSVNLDQGRAVITLKSGHFWTVCDFNKDTNRALLYNPYGYYQDTKLDNVSLGSNCYANEIDTITQQSTVNGKALVSTTGKDNLVGSSGDDVITGLSGDDYITGSGGKDFLTGGVGRDKFDLRGYAKVGAQDFALVQDFWSVHDQIILDKSQAYAFGAITYEPNSALASRDLFQNTGGTKDLVATLRGSSGDLGTLAFDKPCFQFI